MLTYLYPLIAVIVVSAISFVGVLFLSFQRAKLNRVLIFLVSFAAGAFFGDVFFHLIPEMVEESGWTMGASVAILAGIVFFLVIEKVVHWRHCHDLECEEHPKTLAVVNLVGDGLHNFIDGLIIGASFLISVPVGIATTLAVIFHEIPQEIGDFGVLLYGGYSKKKALLFNFLSATTAIIGTVTALLLYAYIENITAWLVPFAIGAFLYIAGSDLIPEIKNEESISRSILQVVVFTLGIGAMAALLLVE